MWTYCSCVLLWLYLSLCSHPFKHSQLHTFAGLYGKHTCSRDVPRSIICFINTEWFKAWICCLPLKPKLNRIALALALTESALLLFPGTSLTRSFLFLCSLLHCLWDIEITLVISGTEGGWSSPLRVVFPPYRRGHTDPFLLCDRRLFPELITWHDNKHACTSLLTPANVLTARLEPNYVHLDVFKL